MTERSSRYIERPDVPLVTGFSQMPLGRSCFRPDGLCEWLLWYTTRGECRIVHSCGEILSRAGELVLIAPDTPQNYGTITLTQRWECWWVVFQPRAAWNELLDWPQAAPGVMRLEPREQEIRRRILKNIRQAHHFASVHSRRHQDFAMNALESTLLWCDTQNTGSQGQCMDERLRRAIEAITHNLAHKWTLAAIASAAGVSEPHAVRLFRRQLNQSPLRYVEQRRLERARQLLQHTVQRISDISNEIGFENPFYFSLRFKKDVGVNPRDYRRQSQSAIERTAD